MLLHAGAPQYNSTLFCEATQRECYLVMSTAAGFAEARASCQALGGASDLVMYSSGGWVGLWLQAF